MAKGKKPKKRISIKEDLEWITFHSEENLMRGLKIHISFKDYKGAHIKHIISMTKLMTIDKFPGYTLVEEEVYMRNKHNIYVNMTYDSWNLKGKDEVGRAIATFRNLLYDNGYKKLGDRFFKSGNYKDLLAWD